MKTEKLTLQDCFKYPKAKIQDGSIVWKNITEFIREDSDLFHDVNWKLILRPLSSLTDEEKKELVRYCHYDNTILDITKLISAHNLEDYFVPEVDEFHIKVIDYLRSINIDIDRLQERGIAVYE